MAPQPVLPPSASEKKRNIAVWGGFSVQHPHGLEKKRKQITLRGYAAMRFGAHERIPSRLRRYAAAMRGPSASITRGLDSSSTELAS